SRFEAEQAIDLLQPLGHCVVDIAACAQRLPQELKRLVAGLRLVRQHRWNSCEGGVRVDQQHQILLAHERLEVGQREALHSTLTAPDTPHHFKAAFVARTSGHADVQEGSHNSLLQPSGWNARLQLGNSGLQQLAMQSALSRSAQWPAARRVDASNRLHRGRAVNGKKHLLKPCIACIPPDVELSDDLPGYRLLQHY